MIVCKTRQELRDCLSDNKAIGFVPTMGSLHRGHLSLIRKAKAENDITVCSIFINPTQFNDPQDFKKYPINTEKDKVLLKMEGCDILFLPQVEEMYPEEENYLKFTFGDLENVMEGKFRPGHFNGVATIVSKLFHFVSPARAYFGQKDLQQFAVIHELVKTLAFPIEVKMCQIVREDNGLAMSSRNERLAPPEREKAAVLFTAINTVHQQLVQGKPVSSALDAGKRVCFNEASFDLEYLSVVDQLSLQELSEINTERNTAICIAGFIGGVRLIDNLVF